MGQVISKKRALTVLVGAVLLEGSVGLKTKRIPQSVFPCGSDDWIICDVMDDLYDTEQIPPSSLAVQNMQKIRNDIAYDGDEYNSDDDPIWVMDHGEGQFPGAGGAIYPSIDDGVFRRLGSSHRAIPRRIQKNRKWREKKNRLTHVSGGGATTMSFHPPFYDGVFRRRLRGALSLPPEFGLSKKAGGSRLVHGLPLNRGWGTHTPFSLPVYSRAKKAEVRDTHTSSGPRSGKILQRKRDNYLKWTEKLDRLSRKPLTKSRCENILKRSKDAGLQWSCEKELGGEYFLRINYGDSATSYTQLTFVGKLLDEVFPPIEF
jgi:hypothetical protein